MSMVGSSVKKLPAEHLDEVQRKLAEKRRERLETPTRSSTEMIEAVLEELNRQLDPLLKRSQREDLGDDDLDRMIRISSATIAIHRQLADGEGGDLGDVPASALRRVAGRGR